MLSLTQSGRVMAWGASRAGCLGLGADKTISSRPEQIEFPAPPGASEDSGPVRATVIVELVRGEQHILARCDRGRVYAWGTNATGQLGVGAPSGNDIHSAPVLVTFPRDEGSTALMPQIIQVVATGNSSFALSRSGEVFSWGANKNFLLGLEGVKASFVGKPTKNTALNLAIDELGQETPVFVTKLQICDLNLICAIVNPDRDAVEEVAANALGGGAGGSLASEPGAGPGGEQSELFDGILMLRETIRKARIWTDKLNKGYPFVTSTKDEQQVIMSGVDETGDSTSGIIKAGMDLLSSVTGARNPGTRDMAEVGAGVFPEEGATDVVSDAQIDEGQNYINSIVAQLTQERASIGKQFPSAGNIAFLLDVFVDSLVAKTDKLERIRRTRAVLRAKRLGTKLGLEVGNFRADSFESIRRLQAHNLKLQDVVTSAEQINVRDPLSRELQVAIAEAANARIQTNLTKMELIKRLEGTDAGSIVKPAIQILQERWQAVQEWSLSTMFKKEGKTVFSNRKLSPDQCFDRLVAMSEQGLDRIAEQFDRDAVLTRDLVLPGIVYELLLDNVRMRKLCNLYQLRVLLIHRGKNLFQDPEATLPKEEVIFGGAEVPVAWRGDQGETKSILGGVSGGGGMFGGMFGGGG
ncbi:unnamed protein product [Amoebophrya sp. A25]|nr:unnamed protein product [Amoebophrya sp. A25]|eukprot:GSA25T00019268001.1